MVDEGVGSRVIMFISLNCKGVTGGGTNDKSLYV